MTVHLDKFSEMFCCLQVMNLKDTEILQVINLEPKFPIEVFLVVKQCEDRLANQGVEKVLSLSKSTIGT